MRTTPLCCSLSRTPPTENHGAPFVLQNNSGRKAVVNRVRTGCSSKGWILGVFAQGGGRDSWGNTIERSPSEHILPAAAPGREVSTVESLHLLTWKAQHSPSAAHLLIQPGSCLCAMRRSSRHSVPAAHGQERSGTGSAPELAVTAQTP